MYRKIKHKQQEKEQRSIYSDIDQLDGILSSQAYLCSVLISYTWALL